MKVPGPVVVLLVKSAHRPTPKMAGQRPINNKELQTGRSGRSSTWVQLQLCVEGVWLPLRVAGDMQQVIRAEKKELKEVDCTMLLVDGGFSIDIIFDHSL